MAFTGYVFNDLNHIYPYLEDAETGPTVIWARRQGNPAHHNTNELKFCLLGSAEYFLTLAFHPVYSGSITFELFCCCWVSADSTSCCFVDRQGNLIATYQKSFLYYTDERWADEGPGFISLQIERLGKVGIGICMDLNPYKYRKASAFEFANFHREHQTQIILCPMNWLDSNPSPSERNPQKPQNSTDSDSDDETTSEDENVSWSSLAYWKGRLSPLYANDEADSLRRPKVIFASCNRFDFLWHKLRNAVSTIETGTAWIFEEEREGCLGD
ncbi:hypothetical protein BC938DRAFT_482244 [Jimgerdemannia flammicorona]|uniref:Carbon-nitrogen hydrolase n=1 Tax=Jimgerdemannia flammicorona TaxID=994334 RepID=A0A433QWN4_9FUNG|nr:hypothetical protein BC938DRAFT_482244 [Jimgerdemannia flammicorona]